MSKMASTASVKGKRGCQTFLKREIRRLTGVSVATHMRALDIGQRYLGFAPVPSDMELMCVVGALREVIARHNAKPLQ